MQGVKNERLINEKRNQKIRKTDIRYKQRTHLSLILVHLQVSPQHQQQNNNVRDHLDQKQALSNPLEWQKILHPKNYHVHKQKQTTWHVVFEEDVIHT